MSGPQDDVTSPADVPPQFDPNEWLRAQAALSVKREHDLARLASVNALDDPDDEEQ